MTEPTADTPTRRRRATAGAPADGSAHAVPSDPNDPTVGTVIAAFGSQFVTRDGVEYRVDPATGVALERVTA